ncbi:hypothetical protein D3C71_1922700 [compost metagenome]
MSNFVGTFDMHLIDLLPIAVVHLVKSLVTQDAGIVDQHINPSKRVQCLLDNTLTIGHRIMVGHRAATRFTNLRHHLIRC